MLYKDGENSFILEFCCFCCDDNESVNIEITKEGIVLRNELLEWNKIDEIRKKWK